MFYGAAIVDLGQSVDHEPRYPGTTWLEMTPLLRDGVMRPTPGAQQ
jgi:hypothetical protein